MLQPVAARHCVNHSALRCTVASCIFVSFRRRRRYDSSLRGETRKADGSIPLPAGPLSASNSSGVALFVPDCNEQATLTTCDGWAGLSFWEVPAYSLPGDNTSSRSDPENLPGFTIQQRFTADFERCVPASAELSGTQGSSSVRVCLWLRSVYMCFIRPCALWRAKP